MYLALDIIIWCLWGLLAYIGVGILSCWALFFVSWLKGWYRDDITPAEILERLIVQLKG